MITAMHTSMATGHKVMDSYDIIGIIVIIELAIIIGLIAYKLFKKQKN